MTVDSSDPLSETGKAPGSVRRFSQFKWATAVVLGLLLVSFGFDPDQGSGSTGAGDTSAGSETAVGDSLASSTSASSSGAGAGASSAASPAPVGAAGSSVASAVGGTTTLLGAAAQGGAAKASAAPSNGFAGAPGITIAVDGTGQYRVKGLARDGAMRDQWLNAVRIGAQGAPVLDELTLGASDGPVPWASRLSSLVEIVRERGYSGLQIDGNRVRLLGAGKNPTDRAASEAQLSAQLPGGYRLDGQPGPGGLSASSATQGAAIASSAGALGTKTGAAGGVASSGEDSGSRNAKTESKGRASSSGSAPMAAVSPGASQSRPSDNSPVAKSKQKPANCPRKLSSLAASVFFKTDETQVSAADRARLQRLGQCATRARVRVTGYADPRYTDSYNQELSLRRAQAVAAEIREGGLASARLTVIGAGKTGSKRTSSAAALQQSRRVDVQVR